MTDVDRTNIKASRLHVARSRGALSGVVVAVLGLWALLVPFIGAYLQLKTTPSPDDAWKWTAARGWLEVLPGAVAAAGGLILLLSANRVVTSFGGWLAAAAGAWLVVGPTVATVVSLTAPVPDPSAGANHRALTELLTFYAIGAAILLFAALALGRLSVHGIADVRAAEKRARREAERETAEREAAERRAADQRAADQRAADRVAADRQPAPAPAPTSAQATGPDGRHVPAQAPDPRAPQQPALGTDGRPVVTSDQAAHDPQHRG